MSTSSYHTTSAHSTETNHDHHASHASTKEKTMKKESAPTTSTRSAATPTTAIANGSLIFTKGPPNVTIPSPPAGYVEPEGSNYRGVAPRAMEMAAMPDVLEELENFPDYESVFGKTSPPLTYVHSVLQAASGWTTQRTAMAAWDAFCRTQEGQSWREARNVTERMAPAYELAVKTDSTLAQRFPGLGRLFSVAKESAAKAVSTRKANKALEAKGELPNKGGVGKKRQRKAEKAAYAAQQQQAANAGGGNGAQAQVAPAQQQVAPGQVQVAPGQAGSGAAGGNGAPGVANGGSGGTNGAAHS